VGNLEDASLALDLSEHLLPGDIGYIFAEDHDAGVAIHLLTDACVQEVHCREEAIFLVPRLGLRVEIFGGGVDVFGVQVPEHALDRRLGMLKCLVGGCGHLCFCLRLERVELLGSRDSHRYDQVPGPAQRTPGVLGFSLCRAPVHPLVVGHGVRVRTCAVRVDQRRASTLPGVSHGLGRASVHVHDVRAVTLHYMQVREALDEP
jgi:hypothetical protein